MNSSYASINEKKEALLINDSKNTVQNIFNDLSVRRKALQILNKANSIMICPSVYNVSILIHKENGQCLLLSKDAENSWSDPAFYKIKKHIISVHMMYHSSQMIFFIMNTHTLQKILNSPGRKININSKISKIESINNTSKYNENIDIYIIQKINNVLNNFFIKDLNFIYDTNFNKNFYHQDLPPDDIVVKMKVNTIKADPIRRALMKYSPILN